MSASVLDASAVLAMLNGEPGEAEVRAVMGRALVSTVNLSEVGARLVERGMTEADMAFVIGSLDAEVVAFDVIQAREAAALRPRTRALGLSLGDRACLALARLRGFPVLTADRSWASVAVGVDIRVIR
ncbi:MAG: type II toxin-antitoxin system VapC family toxin [Alphaproteobacteria bacterium]|nr:type II toxin-antitoxin system VapC family toxin [Alphaproteobacteria bacterium]